MGFFSTVFSKVCSAFTSFIPYAWKAYGKYSENVHICAMCLGFLFPFIAFPMGVICCVITTIDVGTEGYNIFKEYRKSTSWKQFFNYNTVKSVLNIAQITIEKYIPFIKESRTKVRAALQTIKTKINATSFFLNLRQFYQNRDRFSLSDIPSIINGGLSVFKDAILSLNMLSNLNNVQKNTGAKVNDQNSAAENKIAKNELNKNTSEKPKGNTNKSKQRKENTQGNRQTLSNTQALNNSDTYKNQKLGKKTSSAKTQNKKISSTPSQNTNPVPNYAETSVSHKTVSANIKNKPKVELNTTPNQSLISLGNKKCIVCGSYNCRFKIVSA